MLSLLLPTFLQMVVMLIRKQLVIRLSRGARTPRPRVCLKQRICTFLVFNSRDSERERVRWSSGQTIRFFWRWLWCWDESTRSLRAWFVWLRGQQLLGPNRKSATVLRHFIVVAIRDTRRVELGHQVVDLLGSANEGAEGKLVVRSRILDPLDLGLVRTDSLEHAAHSTNKTDLLL